MYKEIYHTDDGVEFAIEVNEVSRVISTRGAYGDDNDYRVQLTDAYDETYTWYFKKGEKRARDRQRQSLDAQLLAHFPRPPKHRTYDASPSRYDTFRNGRERKASARRNHA